MCTGPVVSAAVTAFMYVECLLFDTIVFCTQEMCRMQNMRAVVYMRETKLKDPGPCLQHICENAPREVSSLG